MTTGFLALTALLTVAPAEEPVLLTPDNLAERGFHLRVIVVDDPDKIANVREDPPLRPRVPWWSDCVLASFRRGNSGYWPGIWKPSRESAWWFATAMRFSKACR